MRRNIFDAASTERTIREGSLVIVYLSRDLLQECIVQKGGVANTRYGQFKHDDMIGMRYGCKMNSTSGRGGFCHLLRPTPELWSMALKHRTQILYMPDIAFITSYLDLKPGSRVIEAGTGSGSFSHAIARTVGPSGRVFSFEFHEQRASEARQEFEDHGLSDTIELEHRNVCKDGFGAAADVDAVFLDLPAPWEAIPDAKKAMATDRLTRICCFSPCIEQVSRNVAALHEHGFTAVTMYETLVRQHDQITHNVPTIDDAITKLREIEAKKKQRHEDQVAFSRQARLERLARKEQESDAVPLDGEAGSNPAAGVKRKADAMEDGATATTTVVNGDAPAGDAVQSSTQTNVPEDLVKGQPDIIDADNAPTPRANGQSEPVSRETSVRPAKKLDRRENTTKPAPQIRGHTSYLTFAFLLPHEPGTDAPMASASDADTSYAQVYKELASQDLAGLASGEIASAAQTIEAH